MVTPTMGEFATAEKIGESGWMGKMIPNKDKILMSRGGDFEIYREVHRDDQVASTFQQRRTAVISAEYDVEPASDSAQDIQVAEFVKEQLNKIKFDRLTNKMLFALFYGYAVAEINWQAEGGMIGIKNIKVKRQEKYRWNQDGILHLMTMNNPQGTPVPDRKFWTLSVGAENDDNPYGLGLAHYLYWPVYFKKNGLKFWLIFLEKFGMPTSMAKMTSAAIENPTLKRQALEALQAIQTDSGVLVPDGVVIELIEAARSGAADYESLQIIMNKAISKIVLSQTMTTDDGSSRSQSETHNGVKNDVIKADADLVCESFNDQVIRWLVDFNFGEDVPAPRVWRNTEPEENELERVERDKGISELGFEPTEDYIREHYGEGWQKKQQPMTMPGFDLNQDDEPGAPSFSEVGRIDLQKRAHRADQQAIAISATQIANDYQKIIGDRVNQLLNQAEDSGDFASFREHLNEMLAEGPTEQTIERVENAGMIARLMGWLARQR